MEVEPLKSKRTSKTGKAAGKTGRSEESGSVCNTDTSVDQLEQDASSDGVMSAQEGPVRVEAEEAKFRRARASRTVDRSLDATQLYLNEIGYSPLLTADEEKYYARLALKGDDAGRKRMIESLSLIHI